MDKQVFAAHLLRHQRHLESIGNQKVLLDYHRWLAACDALIDCFKMDRAVALWCKYPQRYVVPSIFQLIARWMQTWEMIELVEEIPYPLNQEHQQDEEANGLFSRDRILEYIARLDGSMAASEDFLREAYEGVLHDQLEGQLEAFRRLVTIPYNAVQSELESDELDVEFVYEMRDDLDYARAAVNVIQMDSHGERLRTIDYRELQQSLNESDSKFRRLYEQEARSGVRHVNLVAPQEFWWRR